MKALLKKVVWGTLSTLIFIGYRVDELRAAVLLRMSTYASVPCSRCTGSKIAREVLDEIDLEYDTEVICPKGTLLSGCWSYPKSNNSFFSGDDARVGYVLRDRCTNSLASCYACPSPGTVDSLIKRRARQKTQFSLCSWQALTTYAGIFVFRGIGQCYLTTYSVYIDNDGWSRKYESDCHISTDMRLTDEAGTYRFTSTCYY